MTTHDIRVLEESLRVMSRALDILPPMPYNRGVIRSAAAWMDTQR